MVILTDWTLSKPQEDVLRLWLNFAPAPTKLPLVDTIAAVEEGARQLNDEDAEDLRGCVCGILRHAKPPKDNLTKEQRKALKELGSLEDEVILPADKGNATVMMMRDDNDTKMRGILDSHLQTTEERPNCNPTGQAELKAEKNGEGWGDHEGPSGSQPPRIYGLPKIHKPEVPLMPIVSCIRATSYQLSKHIAYLMSPLAGKTDSHVKNSKHFVEVMAGLRVEEDEMLVRFDVTSLFTNVPIDEAFMTNCKEMKRWQTGLLFFPTGSRNCLMHVKRGLVKFLYDRARSITTVAGHLAEGRVPPQQSPEAEGLPQSLHPLFISAFCSCPGCGNHRGIATGGGHRSPLVVLPYTKGVSDDIRWVCRKFAIKVVFRSGRSLCSMLTKVKDALAMEKMSKVVYQVPCSCGKAYVGKTVRRLETRLKEHRDACQKGALEKSTLAEHAWESHHAIKWKETTVVDQASTPK